MATKKFFTTNHLSISLVCLLLLLPRTTPSAEAMRDWPRRRRLAPGDFTDFNRILRGAVLRLPDAEFSSDGANLKLSQVRCRNLAIGDLDLRSNQASLTSVEVNLQVTDLDMSCQANYKFSAWWLFGGGGSGTADIRSSGNDAFLKGQVYSANFAEAPPKNIAVLTCNPTVYIQDVSFSDGGLFGKILNIFKGLLADWMESHARGAICAQLLSAMEDTEGLLQYAKQTLDQYKPNGVVVDPLSAEKGLSVLSGWGWWVVNDDTNLLNFRDDGTKFAGWLESSVNRVVDYLSSPAEDPVTGRTDMQANILLRRRVLEGGALEIKASDLSNNDYDSVVYEGHNRITKTSVRFDSVRMVGLDSLKEFNPLDTIGDYTFQNQISWDYLGFQIQATIEMTPSTSSDSIIETPERKRIEEKVEIFLGLDDLIAELSIISLFDQDLLRRVKLGSLMEKDNILPCLLSTILYADVTSFSVDFTDVLTPTMSGFVSPGMDHIFSDGIEAGFIMYEKILLKAAPRYFQEKIRPILAETFVKTKIDSSICAPLDWSGSASVLIDFRDLLLPPPDALDAGATGKEPYGNVLSSFAMPYLKEKVFQGEIFNADYIRPFTESQSGIEGSLVFSDMLLQYKDTIPSSLYDSLVFTVSDLRLHNVDTVVDPLSVLDPVDWSTLSNTIAFDGSDITGDNPLTMAVRIALKIGGSHSPLHMQNTFDLNFSIPASALSFAMLANLRESSLMNFPVIDLANYHCWLASLDNSMAEGLILSVISLDIDSFQLDSKCVSCTSPGMAFLPNEILQNLEFSGFNYLFHDKIVAMLVDAITDFTQNFRFKGIIDAAPNHCPHHPSYDPAAKVAHFSWPGLPALRYDSAETAIAIGLIALQSTMIGAAKNHLLRVGEGTNPSKKTIEMDFSKGSRIVNWTTLDEDIGDWAEVAFEELRNYLTRAVEESPKNNTRSSRPTANLHVNEILRDHFLDTDGAYTINFNGIEFAALDLELKLSAVKVHALDSILAVDPLVFVSTSPQMLMNSFQFETLQIAFEVEVGSNSGYVKPMTISYELQDIIAQVDIHLALDLAILEGIQLGSIFDIDHIAFCAISGIWGLQLSTLDFRFDSIEGPVIDGYFSDDNQQNIQDIFRSLSGIYRTDLTDALPLVFDSTLREILNAMLPMILDSASRLCPPTRTYPSTGVVDFRDLLLSKSWSSSFGGSGNSPYGNLFPTLYNIMQKKMQTGASNRPLVNDMLRQLTDRISNVPGSVSFEGNSLKKSGRIEIAGFRATFGIVVSDVAIQNVDSVGDPLDIFRPLLDEANILNNIVSFGVDSKPLKVTGKLLLSLFDDANIQMRNEMSLDFSLENIVLVFSFLLTLMETNFAEFPLGDLTNIHCWLSTILSKSEERSSRLRGIDLVDHSVSVEKFSLDVKCTSCSSPKFDVLLSSLYNFSNTSEAINTIRDKSDDFLDADFTEVFLDHVVDDSASKCPHRPEYDPNTLRKGLLLSTAETLGRLQDESGEKPIYFTVINSMIAGFIFLLGALCRWAVGLHNKQWMESLSNEGRFYLEMHQKKEKQTIEMINKTTTSLFNSETIPRRVRHGVPVVLVSNFGLLLGAHLSLLYIVDVDASLGGEELTINNFLEFTFLESSRMTFKNGGAEMVILIWIFAVIWPYIRIFLSLVTWMSPPKRLGVESRGRILLWIDAAATLSIVDIFTVIVGVALLLVFIGGPDDSYVSEDLYSLKAIIVPGAGFYCMIIAQRISRTSSRFLLEYHEQVIYNAAEGYESMATATEIAPAPEPLPGSDTGKLNQPQHKLQGKESPSPESKDHVISQVRSETGECEVSTIYIQTTTKKAGWGLIGVYFGATTIVIVFIIGAIFAPSISLDASSLAALAIESHMTCEEIVQNFGVFSVVSGVLLKARFVFHETANFIGFGLLLFAGIVSIGAVFIMKVYKFIKEKTKERQSAHPPSFGHTGCGILFYIRLTKWRYMEIYLISFAVGIWQLGAISSYSIHVYCEILNRMFSSMNFIGLAKEEPAECYNIQASLPENLGIILMSFGILLMSFILQAYSQYKKNILESLRWIDNDDIPRLSLAWSEDKSKNRKYLNEISSRTAFTSWDSTRDSMEKPIASSSKNSGDASSKFPSFED